MKKSKVFKAIAIGAACLSAPLFLIGCGKTDKKYYITFKVDNQTYTYKTTENQSISNMTNPTKYGHVFEGWYSDAEYQNKVDDLSEYLVANSKVDTTLYAKFSIGQFTIIFNTNGGSEIASITQDYMSIITEPEEPAKPGYHFAGWYSDPDFTQKFIFNKMPGRNITLYAKFESYLIVNNYGKIMGLTEEGQTLSSIIIPEEINGITIKSIGERAFFENENLETITFNDKIQTIGDFAFSKCSKLTSVEIPDSVTSIGESAFALCTSLNNAVMGDGLTSISKACFLECSSLHSINLGENIKLIGELSLSGTGLTSIDLTGISIIDTAAFSHSRLINITIPASVTYIGEQAFRSCLNLEAVEMGEGHIRIPQSMFYECIDLKTFVLPESIEIIEEHAFAYSGLTGIDLTGVKTIEDCAFAYSKLANITISDSVRAMGEQVFYGCKNLETVTIGEKLTEIPLETFALCEDLTTITLGSNVETIRKNAFYGCGLENIDLTGIKKIESAAFANSGLTSVKVSDSVKSMGEQVFYHCNQLQSVEFGTGLTDIPEETFALCGNLTNVTFGSAIKNIGDKAFYGAGLSNIDLTGIQTIGSYVFYESSVKNINLTGITSIGELAFAKCVELEKISLPEGLQTIPQSLFSDCSNLRNVEIPSTVTTIEDRAFRDCISLTSIFIPKSVTNIKTSYNNEPQATYSPFYNCYTSMLIFMESEIIPEGFEKYWNYTDNRNFSDTIVYGDCDKEKYEYKNGLYIIGREFNYSLSSLDDYDSYNLIEVKDKSVENFEFYEISGTINRNAFLECENLKTIELKSRFALTDEETLKSLTNLTTIIISLEFGGDYFNTEYFKYWFTDVPYVYITTGLMVSGDYFVSTFTKQEISDKDGYDMYVRNA